MLKYLILVTMVSAYYSDKYNVRAIPIALISCPAIAGFSLYLCKCQNNARFNIIADILSSASENKHVAYGSLFLTVPGVYALAPVISAWMANNSEPYYRRATSIALGFVATNAVCGPFLLSGTGYLTLYAGRNPQYLAIPD